MMPTTWPEMAGAVVLALDRLGPAEAPHSRSELQWVIQDAYGEGGRGVDSFLWELTGSTGKAFDRALDKLVERGNLLRDEDGFGYSLAWWGGAR